MEDEQAAVGAILKDTSSSRQGGTRVEKNMKTLSIKSFHHFLPPFFFLSWLFVSPESEVPASLYYRYFLTSWWEGFTFSQLAVCNIPVHISLRFLPPFTPRVPVNVSFSIFFPLLFFSPFAARFATHFSCKSSFFFNRCENHTRLEPLQGLLQGLPSGWFFPLSFSFSTVRWMSNERACLKKAVAMVELPLVPWKKKSTHTHTHTHFYAFM